MRVSSQSPPRFRRTTGGGQIAPFVTHRPWAVQSRACTVEGAGRLAEAQQQELWTFLQDKGWRLLRGPEGGWAGGWHINIIGPSGEQIHLPISPGFVPSRGR